MAAYPYITCGSRDEIQPSQEFGSKIDLHGNPLLSSEGPAALEQLAGFFGSPEMDGCAQLIEATQGYSGPNEVDAVAEACCGVIFGSAEPSDNAGPDVSMDDNGPRTRGPALN